MTQETSDNEYRARRMEHLEALQERGLAPFGGAFGRTGRLAELRAEHVERYGDRVIHEPAS